MVDTLAKQNMKEPYKNLNPTMQIPMLTQGINQIIAPGFVLYEWILKTNENAAQTFYHEEQENSINAIQRYFFREIRGNTSQLIRRLAMKVLSPEKAPSPQDPKTKERLEFWLREFDE